MFEQNFELSSEPFTSQLSKSFPCDEIREFCLKKKKDWNFGWLTEVDIVISSALAVHLVDKEAGHRLEEQVEDGHTETEAKRITPPADGQVVARIKDPKVDDVSQHCYSHS